MEVDWPCPEKGNIRNTKGSIKMDSTWKKKQRAAKGDMAEVSGEGEGLMFSRHEED